jgi:hypothetical protein
MARAHEQFRLRKPVDGASHVRAIDGEDLELIVLDMPHPARKIARLAVGWSAIRIAILRQPGFSRRKSLKIPHWNPVVVAQIPLENWT